MIFRRNKREKKATDMPPYIKITFSEDKTEQEKQYKLVLDILVFNGIAVWFYNGYCLVEDTPKARAYINYCQEVVEWK